MTWLEDKAFFLAWLLPSGPRSSQKTKVAKWCMVAQITNQLSMLLFVVPLS